MSPETQDPGASLNNEASGEVQGNDEGEAQLDDSSQEEAPSGKEPNIKFVGREQYTVAGADGKIVTDWRPRVPVTKIMNGMEAIKLPNVDIQNAGAFYHPKADTICQLFPSLYKRFR